MSELEILSPQIEREHEKIRRGVADIARRVAVAALIQRPGRDMLSEVYIAGLYHGSRLAERASAPAPRVIDRIDITAPRKRGRRPARRAGGDE